jgi:MYXO-CTERM domain-containing protein
MTFRRLLPFAFWAALLFAFVMAVLPKPPQLPGQPSDKVQHILAFAVLAALAAAAYPRMRLPKILLLLSLFGALIEAVQTIPALHRDGDWVDWVADTLAAALVLGLAALLRRRFPPG